MRVVLVEKLIMIFISDIHNYVQDVKFWMLNSLIILGVGYSVAQAWPHEFAQGFIEPLVGRVFVYSLAIILLFSNLYLVDGLFRFKGVHTISQWKHYGGFSTGEIVTAKALSVGIQNIVLLVSTVPVGVLVSFVSGLPVRALLHIYLMTAVLAISTGWLRLVVNENFRQRGWLVAIFLGGLFILALVITAPAQYAYLDLRVLLVLLGLSIVLLLDLVIDVIGLMFR